MWEPYGVFGLPCLGLSPCWLLCCPVSLLGYWIAGLCPCLSSMYSHTVPCHTIPYHSIPYHTIPYRTVPYQVQGKSGVSVIWLEMKRLLFLRSTLAPFDLRLLTRHEAITVRLLRRSELDEPRRGGG